jgi:hypothetical protein
LGSINKKVIKRRDRYDILEWVVKGVIYNG